VLLLPEIGDQAVAPAKFVAEPAGILVSGIVIGPGHAESPLLLCVKFSNFQPSEITCL
jgi:hypothetical protein